MPAPLAGLRFSLVGPGRVGGSLARWIVARGGSLEQVAGTTADSGAALAAALGARPCELAALDSAEQELLLVAVADRALEEVAAALARRKQAETALHTCGSRGAAVLAPLAARGVATGSLHPLYPFPHPLAEPPPGLVLGIDGAVAAEGMATRLADAWGATVARVPEESRAVYHLAAVLSAGGLTTLLALAHELAARGALPSALAPGFVALAGAAVAAAATAEDPADAITGPWARGDSATVARHLAAIARLAPESQELVRALSAAGVAQCRRRRPDDPSLAALATALAEERIP